MRDSKIIKMEDILRGVEYISDFLSTLRYITAISEDPDYSLPRYIYRGVSCFYEYHKENATKKPSEESVKNGYIRSSLSVRIDKGKGAQEQEGVEFHTKKPTLENASFGDAYLRENYITILQDMIRNARKYYPEKYTVSMSDLDILADIQHNGGATCLVDFSKNILTALWFACQSDFDCDGFVYCYDIMEDMIAKDSLTYIRPEDENRSIFSLLVQTYRETNICSESRARFCLWEPSPKNNRILRQDSLFLFGIEPFVVGEHPIKVIRINSDRKRYILYALNGLFNISGKTIYNDHVGYAIMNRKENPCDKLNDTPYHRGFINMIKGNYNAAVDFFKLWEGDQIRMGKGIALKRKIELYFSLAVCYKNLHRKQGTIHYYENAILEYKQVIACIKKMHCDNTKETNYYSLKLARAYSGIIDVLYYSEKYLEAISMCDELIASIDKYHLEKYSSMNTKYCKIVKMELLDLVLLKYYVESKSDMPQKHLDKFKKKMDSYYSSVKKYKEDSLFDKWLIYYYKFIFDILTSQNELRTWMKEWQKEEEDFNVRRSQSSTNASPYSKYILWNFEEIKQMINRLPDTSNPKKKNLRSIENNNKKMLMQYATAYMISYRDEFEMQSWGSEET